MAKPLRLRQMGLAHAEFFLRPFALSDVNHGTHEFNQIAGGAENGMAYHVDVSNFAAGMNDSVILLELRLLAPRSLGCFPNFGWIIRMIKPKLGKQPRERGARRRSSSRITESFIPAAKLETSTW